MNHSLLTFTVNDDSFIRFAQSKDINPIFIKSHEIIVLLDE